MFIRNSRTRREEPIELLKAYSIVELVTWFLHFFFFFFLTMLIDENLSVRIQVKVIISVCGGLGKEGRRTEREIVRSVENL